MRTRPVPELRRDAHLAPHRKRARCHYCHYSIALPRAARIAAAHFWTTERRHGAGRRGARRAVSRRADRAHRPRHHPKRRAIAGLLSRYAEGEIDILVGTQMIAKGHDFPNVTLVGVVSVEPAWPTRFPLGRTDVSALDAGRRSRGRGETRGPRDHSKTYHPQHYSIVFAREQNYEEFFKHEANFRRSMHYPPFSAMVNVLVHDKDLQRAEYNRVAVRGAELQRSRKRHRHAGAWTCARAWDLADQRRAPRSGVPEGHAPDRHA